MGNMLLAYGNRVGNGVLSGGNPFSTMPVTNLQDRQLGVLWRTANLDPMSTMFNLHMPDSDTVKIVALANHNLSLDAQYRLRASDDPTFAVVPAVPPTTGGAGGSPIGGLLLTITGPGSGSPGSPGVDILYDSGLVDVWPTVYATDSLEWEDDNWWSGKYAQEDLAGYIRTLSILLPTTIRALYWRLEFFDQENPDGYVQAGRLFLAPAWQPVYNASYGATLGWEDGSDVQQAISGAEFYDVKVPFRVATFKFDTMTEDEGLSRPFEIIRKSGTHEEVLFMWDPEDTIHATRRQFLGRLRALSPLEFPEGFINNSSFRTSVPMVVKELVS